MSEKKLCFVIGPIGDPKTSPDVRRHADWLFQGIIKPVFARYFSDEFDAPVRADEIAAPGIIHTQIIQRLFEAPLVIADLSLHNANAFYELAIRHMISLPTIHMYQKDLKPPFDVAPHRAIPFARDDYVELERAQADLKSAIDEVLKPGFVVENPITHARGVIDLDQRASPDQRVLLNRLEALEQQMQRLDRSVSQEWRNLSDFGKPIDPAHPNSLQQLLGLGPDTVNTVRALLAKRSTTYPSE
jgi:hypothetical protein